LINQILIIFSSSKTLLMEICRFLRALSGILAWKILPKALQEQKSNHKSRKWEKYLSVLRLSQF